MTVSVLLRATKGSPLTNAEVDSNFSALRDGVNQALSAGSGTVSLPIASSTVLGGIKIGSGLSVDSNGVVSASGGSGSGSFGVTDATGIGNVGSLANVSIISAPTILKKLAPGSGISIVDGGAYVTISATGGGSGGGSYTLPPATSYSLGGIIVGSGLSISGGVLSVTGGGSGGSSGVSSFNSRTGAISLTSSDITSALGFTPAASGGGGSSGVTSVNSRTGAVTITSSDITSALGFTPAASGSSSGVSSLNGMTGAITIRSNNLLFNAGGGFIDINLNSGGGCIHPLSSVVTTTGHKFAQDVRPGDEIVMPTGTAKVLSSWTTILGGRHWYEINNSLVLTHDHPVKLQAGWGVIDVNAYATERHNQFFTCKTPSGMMRARCYFGELSTFKALEVGDVLADGTVVTSITEHNNHSMYPTINFFTDTPTFVADGIEVANIGVAE